MTIPSPSSRKRIWISMFKKRTRPTAVRDKTQPDDPSPLSSSAAGPSGASSPAEIAASDNVDEEAGYVTCRFQHHQP